MNVARDLMDQHAEIWESKVVLHVIALAFCRKGNQR